MIIKKLNTVFHKHSRILFGAFTLIIIVSFMEFLTPGKFGCGESAVNPTVGEVYGQKVSREDLNEFVRKLSALQQLQNLEFDQLLFFYAMNVRADQLGICVSDDEVGEFIAGLPQCQKDGKYDKEKYAEYLETLKKRGFGEEDLLESIRLVLKQEKLREFVASQVEVTPSEVATAFREYNTKLYFTTASFDDVNDPSDATLRKYFADNRAKYCCAKAAVFPPDPKDPMAAERLAYEFRTAVNTAAPEKREAEFDALAKKSGIKVLPATWIVEGDIAFGKEQLPVLTNYIFRCAKNPADKKPLTDIAIDRASRTCYVGCLVNTAGRDEFAAVKARVKSLWRTEQALKLVLAEVAKLGKEPKIDVRRKKFFELTKLPGVKVRFSDKAKPFVFTKPKPNSLEIMMLSPEAMFLLQSGVAFAQIGDAIPVPTKNGASIYLLDKRVPPTAAMTPDQQKECEMLCRAAKSEAAWRSFVEEVGANCKSPLSREEQR